eukprot:gnl/MRDRNA2_/MRDRNA2_63585_c0_seq1.p1 gnl/MRDRNA2_/MRDRNA2_63585_c0~~gnl/MRDRNA2_/MRDRNA2_63585_c0_seq1.p1  ORF type:complete len:1021 (+),score=176.16 gnl/MRDRNA2_/MRDRNA2_63585_c0_seq1:258-3065(+)
MADLDALDSTGASVLMHAVIAQAHIGIKAVLVAFDVSAKRLQLALPDENQQLLDAAKSGRNTELEVLLMGSVPIDHCDDATGQTALHLAAFGNRAATVDLLIRKHANLNIQDLEGRAPLHLAVENNATIAVNRLLKFGAMPTPVDNSGCTPFLRALHLNHASIIAEFRKTMAPWMCIEEILCAEPSEQSEDWRGLTLLKSRKILETTFGDATADPMKGRCRGRQGCERFQVLNRFVTSTNNGGVAILQSRGSMICRELLLPLLSLATEGVLIATARSRSINFQDSKAPNSGSETQDKSADMASAVQGASHLRLLRYLLASGVKYFADTEVAEAVDQGLGKLERMMAAGLEEARKTGFAALTRDTKVQEGRASLWTMMHQYFAHGPLDWLPATEPKVNTLGAAAALASVGAFKSIDRLCDYLLAGEDPIRGKPNVKFMTIKLRETVYTKWLHECACIAHHKLYGRLRELLGFKAVVHVAPPKTLEKVLETKINYSRKTRFALDPDTRPNPEGTQGNHPLEAGGILDIARCSVVCSDREEIENVLKKLRGTDPKVHGFEIGAIENGFLDHTAPGSYRDVKVTMLSQVPEAGPYKSHAIEVQLILEKMLNLRKHLCLFKRCQIGEFFKAESSIARARRIAQGDETETEEDKKSLREGVDWLRFESEDNVLVEGIPTGHRLWAWSPATRLQPPNSNHSPWRIIEVPPVNVASQEPGTPTSPTNEPDTPTQQTSNPISPKNAPTASPRDDAKFNEFRGLVDRMCVSKKVVAEIIDRAASGAHLYIREVQGEAADANNDAYELSLARDLLRVAILDSSGDLMLCKERPSPKCLWSGRKAFMETYEIAARRLILNEIPEWVHPHLEYDEAEVQEAHNWAWIEAGDPENTSRQDRLEDNVHAEIPSAHHIVPICLRLKQDLDPIVKVRLGLDVNHAFVPPGEL